MHKRATPGGAGIDAEVVTGLVIVLCRLGALSLLTNLRCRSKCIPVGCLLVEGISHLPQ